MNVPNINIPIYELNEDKIRYYASIFFNSASEYARYVDEEVHDGQKIEEITMEAILGIKYRRGKIQYLVKWETIDDAEWIDADKCDKQLIKEYLNKCDEPIAKTKPNFDENEDDSREDIPARIKGDWEEQVEKVENMFKHEVTGEWYSSLKWKNGSRSAHPNKVANIKCPQKLIEEVNWLREAYTHKCSEVGYLSGEADRMKWLYDQSCEQIASLRTQNELFKKELDESEYLRNKLIEHINVETKAIKKVWRHNNIVRGGRHQNFRNLSLNLKKTSNYGNGNIKNDKEMKNSQWYSADEKFCRGYLNKCGGITAKQIGTLSIV
ncbi:19112_t:CDS:2 [Funneliformis geosporum]|uniref:18892_t:CDS:1 n=1 Tax=Funneliformis geosporum TaxID=1117311 RepID=A0A9W4SVA6_9GLOM|nr:19112_t:CDS:2 [Funneliformis geosporum]CAI2182641.1 18892_t:CDS:2 [Funneliformis geosporum]